MLPVTGSPPCSPAQCDWWVADSVSNATCSPYCWTGAICHWPYGTARHARSRCHPGNPPGVTPADRSGTSKHWLALARSSIGGGAEAGSSMLSSFSLRHAPRYPQTPHRARVKCVRSPTRLKAPSLLRAPVQALSFIPAVASCSRCPARQDSPNQTPIMPGGAAPLATSSDVNRIEAPVTWKAYLICAFASFGGILFGTFLPLPLPLPSMLVMLQD